MNPLIRDMTLWASEKADKIYVEPVRSKESGKIREDGHIPWHDIYNEQFAKLIIQKCTQEVALFGLSNFDNEFGRMACNIIDNIYEKFGMSNER